MPTNTLADTNPREIQIVDIPGVGEVEFPGSMSDDEITAAAGRLHNQHMGGDVLVDNVRTLAGAAGDVITGAAKGAASTAVGFGRLVHKIPGVSAGVDKLYDLAGVSGVNSAGAFAGHSAETGLGLDPANTAQKVGKFAEQAAEYAIPAGAARSAAVKLAPAALGRVIPAMAAEGLSAASVATAHGEDPTTAAALSGALPLAGAAAGRVAEGARGTAIRLARAAIKPTVTEMRQTAGASRLGLDAVADRLAKYIVDRRLTSPDKAQAIIDGAEAEIQSLVGSQPTDAATRSGRYLASLERSAARQGLGTDDVATIRNAGRDLLDGPMGRDVVTSTTTMQPGAVLGSNGQPVMIPVVSHQTTRALRPDVPADEALESARASSRWSTSRTWGEQKGAATEASKAVERAQRDAVKDAIPETRAVFDEYSKAIKARDVLARANFRQRNRDLIGLPAHVLAAGEIATGRFPTLGVLSNVLRDNQLPAAMGADRVAGALSDPQFQAAVALLSRLGIAHGAAQPTDDMERELLIRQSR